MMLGYILIYLVYPFHISYLLLLLLLLYLFANDSYSSVISIPLAATRALVQGSIILKLYSADGWKEMPIYERMKSVFIIEFSRHAWRMFEDFGKSKSRHKDPPRIIPLKHTLSIFNILVAETRQFA